MLRVALVVTSQPVREAFQKRRSAAAPGLGEKASERLAHRHDVVPVDRLALEAERGDDVAHALDVRVGRARGELGEAVVLADEDHRQPPERREVDRLDEDPALDRAVAEEDDGDRVVAELSRRQRASERERDVAADDARRTEEAVLDVHEVHRASEPSAETAVATHQLRQHPLGRRALRERVSVRAVAGVDGVVRPQLPADPDRHALLADAQMHQPVHVVGPRERADPLLEDADPPHPKEQLEAEGAVELLHGAHCATP